MVKEITFNDLKMALESLRYEGLENVEADKSLIEDYGIDEDDLDEIFRLVEMRLGIGFPDDDAFYRFAGHMPIGDLVESANLEWDELL